MAFYFQLQFKRFLRHVADAGFPGLQVFLAITALVFLFVGISLFILLQAPYAQYFYPLLAVTAVNSLSGKQRNDFLRLTFNAAKYKRIRLFENALVAVPFAAMLITQQLYLMAAATIAVAMVLSLVNGVGEFHWTVPTFFGKRPFEFTVGFRKTFWLLPLAYILIAIAVQVDNFNLGMSAIVLVYIICFSYYTNPEPSFYIWVFNKNPRQFIWLKVKTIILYSTALSLPVTVALLSFYPEKVLIAIVFQLVGILLIVALMLSKYAYYPTDTNITGGILFGACVLFPPLILLVIPYFYVRSIEKLSAYLS